MSERDYKILPSILAADHGRFIEEAGSVDLPEIEYLHLDIMDGHFVPNITFGPKVVKSLKQHTRFRLDVHLMIENVDFYIPHFAEAGAHRTKAGVALNPATPLEMLQWVLEDVDLVLIMSVNPGFGGQEFIKSSLKKIRNLREMKLKHGYSFIVEVDGGIDDTTAPRVYDAGAEYLVAGNAIFGQKNRAQAIHRMIASIEDYRQKKQEIYT
jgi:ribulose-phosphate 3-epimerase